MQIIYVCNKLDKINELREKINKLASSNNADKETFLALSKELDMYIVDYLKSKGIRMGNFRQLSEL